MNRLSEWKKYYLPLATAVLCAIGLAGSLAYAASEKPAAKPSTPSKPATAAKPASTSGAGHGATSTTRSGPTTGGTHSGPTANSHAGPTTGGNRPTTAGGVHPNTTGRPGGVTANRTATGRIAPAGSHTVATRNGAITRRPDGRISDVHDARRGMDVHHGLDGGRRVSVERADHSRIVAERGRRGYIERRYSYHGHDFARRSYYWHGREYNRYYRGYYYHGAFVNVYAPAVYYPPAFYGWAYNPWAAPVAYGWGWGGTPWYGFYSAYFVPYPVYAGPAFWLADYLVAAELQAAYAAQAANASAAAQGLNLPANQAWPGTSSTPLLVASNVPIAAASDAPAPALTPAIKAQIADEVKAEIALENSEAQQNAQGQDADPASSGIARILGDGKTHVFVAGDSLDVVDSTGAECALSDGDVLQFSGPAPADNQTDVSLAVLASKGGKECQTSATVTVAVADLQEMQNHLRETIDQGMEELKSKQGQNGLPAAPPSATAAPVQSAFAQNAPPPEQNGAADVNQQLAQADQAEQEVAQAAPSDGTDSSAAAAPQPATTVSITLGQTINQVTSSLGAPLAVIDLGSKKIYKYKDMKITFKDGKVADVE